MEHDRSSPRPTPQRSGQRATGPSPSCRSTPSSPPPPPTSDRRESPRSSCTSTPPRCVTDDTTTRSAKRSTVSPSRSSRRSGSAAKAILQAVIIHPDGTVDQICAEQRTASRQQRRMLAPMYSSCAHPTATSSSPGAGSTTSAGGPRVARPCWRTCCHCANSTTTSSTKAAGNLTIDDRRRVTWYRPRRNGLAHRRRAEPGHPAGRVARATTPPADGGLTTTTALPAARPRQSSSLRALMKTSPGTSTRPIAFIFFLPSFCFSSSLRLREMSPP